MKALILVGGFGTRLRPLTLAIPKPLIPFANKPMVVHQIEALKNVGVDEVILAINYRPEVMKKEIDVYAKKFNIKITYSQETTPMGTAGPLALAREVLTKNGNELFFVLNSDISCTYPFQDLIDYHKKHGKEGTIMVTKVSEPSKYGVVVTNENGLIERFVEKPKIFVGNRINAGIYLFSKEILNRIELKPTSIERVIFPKMANDKQLHAMDLEGFWMDVGQPKDYLIGMCMHLSNLKEKKDKRLVTSSKSYKIVEGSVLLGRNTTIGENSVIGPNVVIGNNCVIGKGVRLQRCTIMDNVTIDSNSFIKSSIIGWHSTVGKWCRIENTSVFGEDVHLRSELHINGTRILPHKTISKSVTKENTIIM